MLLVRCLRVDAERGKIGRERENKDRDAMVENHYSVKRQDEGLDAMPWI